MSLKVVSENPLPEPPYPADTKANGWKPEIDYDRIKQSRTWLLCPLHYRPWLLMLWVESWASVPAGSLPDDDEMLAARIGMDFEVFEVAKKYLMRGWKKANDGNFYHQFITDQVLMMLSKRKKTADRVNRYRETKKQQLTENVTRYKNDVTRDQRVSNAQEQEQEQEQELINTHLSTSESETRKRVITRADSVPFEKIQSLWAEICPHLPQPVKLSPARKAIIRARWHDELPDLDSWRECFGHVAASNFLSGRSTPAPGRKPFRCSLDWICKQENLLKLYEGKYDNA